MSLQAEPTDIEAEHELGDERPRRSPTWLHVIVAALAMAVLAGGVGYVIGEGRPPSEDSVDVGFLRDMIDHHEQAVVMALLTVRKDDIDPTTRKFAEETLLFQQREIGLMDAQLESWGRLRGDLDRRAMLWMDMDTAVGEMPGMQTQDSIDALTAATGREADRLFLTMMREHHRGGVHMSQYAARRASSGNVRELASRMARYQETELVEYTMLLQKLGLEA